MPNSQSLNITGSITIEFWMRPYSFGSWRRITIKGSSSNYPFQYWTGQYSTSGQLAFGIRNTSDSEVLTSNSDASFTSNVWHYVAGTYNSSSGELKLYRNGDVVGTTNTNPGNLKSLNINASFGAQGDNNAEHFHGELDEIRIYNRTLKQAEIVAHYQRRIYASPEPQVSYGTEEVGLSSCANLSIQNANYYLTTNVTSAGSCINITANNVTLNCNGFTINYSQSSVGYGVNDSGYNHTTIENCTIVQGGSYGYSYPIFINDSVNNTIKDNNVTVLEVYDGISINYVYNSNISSNKIYAYGYFPYIIHLSYSYNNTVTLNEVYWSSTSSGYWAECIYLDYWSGNNNVTFNNVTFAGAPGNAISFWKASGNNISNNIIHTLGNGSTGIYVYNNNYNNTLSSNTITVGGKDSCGVWLDSSDYNNLTNNTISANGSSAIGIYVYASSNNTVLQTNISVNGSWGIGLYLRNDSDRNVFANMSIRSLQYYAVYFRNSSTSTPDNNTFYNNLFNASATPVAFENITVFSVNYWNTTNQTGTRTYSNGGKIGGNYYTNSTGNGFSDTCTDANQDGFCDSPYNVTTNSACILGSTCENNTDYLAYSKLWEAQSIPYILSTIAGGEFMIKKDGVSYNATASGNINDGTWHHVIAIYDGSLIKIYVDGLLKASTSYSGGIPYSGSNLRIGTNYSSTSTGNFNGTMDNVRIYNRVISEDEIRARANGMCS